MLYVIADLHLCAASYAEKSMEVFGRRWTGYIDKLSQKWRAVVEQDDTVVVPGDISWALSLEDAVLDLKFIHNLPGRKILGKGNHDFWWSTMKKLQDTLKANALEGIDFLYNNAHATDDFIICGTRGWYRDDEESTAREGCSFEKIIARESGRLKMSLDAGKKQKQDTNKEILAFFHFPPVWNGEVCRPFVDLLHEYGVKRCFYGHIHGAYTIPGLVRYENIEFSLISADFIDFAPIPILPDEI